ncbi:hypothetical protein ACFSCX_17970 [Bacillus salitolerans]|uniref:Uncharacterized protein n=1 Tax=Bacillus salitolerans TaxID=1437434 RepID=A0ABW4LUT4_9BACI
MKTGYLVYMQWSIWFSFFAYLLGFSLFSLYSDRLLYYKNPLPYRFRLFSVVYSITAIIGGALGGALIELYQWIPGIFEFPPADDRFVDLGLSLVLGVLIGTIIPIFSLKYRPLMFILITLCIIAFSIYSSFQGWLIYHNWNHFLMAIKWLVPIFIVVFYDRWESRVE